MKRFMRLLKALAVLALAAALPCAAASAQESELASRAMAVYDALAAGDYARVVAQLDDAAAAVLDEPALRAAMEGVLARLGGMTGASLAEADEGARAAALHVAHEAGQSVLQVVFDGAWRVSALVIQPLAQAAQAKPLERALPEGAKARRVVLFPGSRRALAGELITPANADEATPYVVFAHGSGPSDMDETAFANKPFRDIAYDLAAFGVGSLRFDKITYGAPGWPVETVEQEYRQPVAEALRVLRAETRAARVYLVGHSLGGMLAPYLVAGCGFDGGVALAGTPKQLWEISRAQNLALLSLMDGEAKAAAEAQIEAQTALAETLADMTDAQAAQTAVFGMSATYLRHLARMDQAEIAKGSGKPFLFLWGTADAQVDEGAFHAWRERLGDGPYTYAEYDGLNHLFVPAQEGESIATLQEAYAVPQRVDPRVASDIAAWIAAQP